MRTFAFTLALALLVILAISSLAKAEYTPSSLVSYLGSEQAEDAYEPAISANGAYVAFAGSFNGVSGVWRKDLQTGELALVAGSEEADPALSAPDAAAPSISADGRYVSFTTAARLDPLDDQPGDTGGCSSVYVRDMDIHADEPGSYTLASALNGSTQGITYEGSSESGCPGGGSAAADRVALSASGQQVAFTVLGKSDLTTGVGGAVTTEPDQVAVRNLETDTTTLVSQTMSSLGSAEPEAVKGGATIGPLRDSLKENNGREISGSTAAISADGSTVAWMGIDIPEQAPTSSTEDAGTEYAEPLWRDIADGPSAPIRRVTGGDDPLCGCAGPLVTSFVSYEEGGAGGPGAPLGGTYSQPGGFSGDGLTGGVSLDAITPQLSANGQMVAFLSNKPRTSELSPALEEEGDYSTANAEVVNMAPGLTRTQALTPLTEWASDKFSDAASTGAVTSIAISPDGTKVAFTTNRTEFPLTPPALVTPQLSQADYTQLYVANLSAGTLQMASYGYDGEPANGTIATPSFSEDGETIAFASSATNLVYGAFNRGGPTEETGPGNVFVTSLINSPAVAGESYIGAPLADPLAAQSWELLLSTRASTNGSVLLYVTVPGAGSLKASARAEVPVTIKAKKPRAEGKQTKSRAKRVGGKQTKASTAAKRSKPAKLSKRPADTTVATETVASANAVPVGAGLVALHLTPPSKYRSLLEGHDGLYATIAVTFTAPGHSRLTGMVQVTFRYTPPKPAKKTGTKAKKTPTKSSEAASNRRSGAGDR